MNIKWLIFFVLVVGLLASVGNSLWKSMDFDSKFSAYVQNAVGEAPDAIHYRIREIAAEANITLKEDAILIVPFQQGWEVTCVYDVQLGLGGFSYTWAKEVVARTRYGGSVSIGVSPSTQV